MSDYITKRHGNTTWADFAQHGKDKRMPDAPADRLLIHTIIDGYIGRELFGKGEWYPDGNQKLFYVRPCEMPFQSDLCVESIQRVFDQMNVPAAQVHIEAGAHVITVRIPDTIYQAKRRTMAQLGRAEQGSEAQR